MIPELTRIQNVLSSFLGSPKGDMSSEYELEYGCPRCAEHYGPGEQLKFNLAVNIRKGLFKCWKCEAESGDMHGSITKLIKLYGNDTILSDYRNAISEFKNSSLYKLNFSVEDFSVDLKLKEIEELEFPKNYVKITSAIKMPYKVEQYLSGRGIDRRIIEKYGIGFTSYDKEMPHLSNRIVIPSYDKFGSLNYWVGRDFTGNKRRMKYMNPKVDKKSVIFNEEKIQWDADITLVEGPFDHIVVPNSVPLLGKVLKPGFKLYQELVKNARANINIFLDADAFNTAIEVYKVLNHGDLYGKIRYVPVSGDDDPSSIYQKEGPYGIGRHLAQARSIPEVMLNVPNFNFNG